MITYKEFKQQSMLTEDMEDKIALLMFIAENEILNESLDTMNEAELVEGINDWLGKVGMKLHKGDGIIDYIKQFTGGAGKLIMAAVKGDKKKVKEIADSLDKAKVIDFLLKLDMATMHIVTGPIHFVDAVTGWDLMANLKHAAKGAADMLKTFYDAIKKVKDSIVRVLDGEKQQKMLKVAGNLEMNMPDIK